VPRSAQLLLGLVPALLNLALCTVGATANLQGLGVQIDGWVFLGAMVGVAGLCLAMYYRSHSTRWLVVSMLLVGIVTLLRFLTLPALGSATGFFGVLIIAWLGLGPVVVACYCIDRLLRGGSAVV
jgi:hypothetical protein